jgi:outer membrane lipoprotein-sorting protein
MKNVIRTLIKYSITSMAISLLSLSAYAETLEQQGLRIAQETDARDSGFQDFTAHMQMTLRNRAGQKSVRDINIKTLEGQKDGDKTMSVFNTPADIKNTRMLTFSHGLKPDDQWLYLPALKRVKRIASRNKSGPFMGSEFAFEDLGSQEVEKYHYKYLREEPCANGWTCYVSELTPAYQYSGYTKQIVWLDKQEYRLVKVDYYDRKKTLLKTLNNSGYREYTGRYWRPSIMEMKNHQTGKSTTLQWTDYRFKTGLTTRDFNKNTLKR